MYTIQNAINKGGWKQNSNPANKIPAGMYIYALLPDVNISYKKDIIKTYEIQNIKKDIENVLIFVCIFNFFFKITSNTKLYPLEEYNINTY